RIILFFQAEDCIRDRNVTGVQTCALPLLIIVFFIVLIGIVFDMLGIASTAAKEAPLHAMAAEKVKGAKEAVNIYKNADKFASFCNDVIGDISGIISGSALTIVILDF